MVSPNSTSVMLMTMTGDCTSKPRTTFNRCSPQEGTEEEVELEQTNKNLVYEIAPSHLDRSADVLIDCPSKFIK